MLQIKDLSFSVEEGNRSVDILKNINLLFEANKFYAITGPNGGGKSSLAKVIMGIVKPTRGSIWLKGEDITALGITERAKRKMGYAFQQPPRFKGFKIRDLLNLSFGEEKNEDEICDLLLEVGLCAQDYINRDVDASLSGGELKRIEIATVLARNLTLAIFDEPEAGIDLWSFQKLVETFQTMHKDKETTIIIISHQEKILRLADEVIIIADGMVKEQAKRDDIMSRIVKDLECGCNKTCDVGGVAYVEPTG